MTGDRLVRRRGWFVGDRGYLLANLVLCEADVRGVRGGTVFRQGVVIVEVDTRTKLDWRQHRFGSSVQRLSASVEVDADDQHAPREIPIKKGGRVRQLLPEDLHADPSDSVFVVLHGFLAETEEDEEDKGRDGHDPQEEEELALVRHRVDDHRDGVDTA